MEGTSIEEMAAQNNGSAPDETPEPEELLLEVGGQLSFGVGGKRPSTSSITILGGEVKVEGQLDKGAKMRVIEEIVIDEVSFKDETDPKTGQVVGCKRKHKARRLALSVEPLD